jgi:hypothetical protein
MPKISFFDLKTKKKFSTDKFKIETKKKGKRVTNFAVTTSPSGNKAYRIVSADFAKENR